MTRMTPRTLYFSYLGRHWYMYLCGIGAMFINCIGSDDPKCVQWVIDHLARPSPDRDEVTMFLGFLFIALVLGILGRIGWRQFRVGKTHLAGHELN